MIRQPLTASAARTLILGALLVVGCQQRPCQPPPEQPFNTFTQTQWRLVDTNDPNPSLRGLSNSNFLIMTFQLNGTGDIKRVENNDLYETPVATFTYNVDPSARLLVTEIQQNTVTLSNDGGASEPAPAPSQPSTVRYRYDLGREFSLTGTSTGFNYRFVPFTGVVEPDRECRF